MKLIPFQFLSQEDISFWDITSNHSFPTTKTKSGEINNIPYHIGYNRTNNNRTFLNMLFYTVSGTAKITYENTSIVVTPGYLYYIPATVDIITYSESTDYEYYRIAFKALDMHTNEQIYFSHLPMIIFEETSKAIFTDISDLTFAHTYHNTHYKYQSKYLLTRLFYHILQNYNETTTFKHSNIYPAINLLQTQWYENPTNEDLANVCGISEHYFRQQFKKATGMTSMQFKNMYKIRRACEVLKNSNLNIEEVADYLGFTSAHYFCRVFKSVMGMTATEYKKKR